MFGKRLEIPDMKDEIDMVMKQNSHAQMHKGKQINVPATKFCPRVSGRPEVHAVMDVGLSQ